jgi:hypothetical protein
MSSSSSEHNRQIAEMVAKTKDQIAALDRALSEELTKSLESFGRQLSALSEKFVSDYTPLTDRLSTSFQECTPRRSERSTGFPLVI